MDSEQFQKIFAKELQTRPLSIVVLESLVSVITAVITVVGNALVLLTIFRNTRLRRPANLYIVSLAIADLLMGILCCPLRTSAVIIGDWKLGRAGCWFSYILDYTITGGSILTMFLIAVNRYFKIVIPNKYASVFSLRFILASIVMAWIFALTFSSIISSVGIEYNLAFFVCSPSLSKITKSTVVILTAAAIAIVLPFCFISLLYYKIWIFVRQHNAHMNQSQVNLAELKLTKSLFAVVGSFSICYLPFGVIVTFSAFFQSSLPRQFYFFCAHMLMISSCINPIIYGVTNREFRKEFLKLISSCCAKRTVVGPSKS